MANSQEKDQAQSQTYNQSHEIELEKARIFRIIQDDKQRRDQQTTFFRNETLQTYTSTSIGQFIGYRTKPAWKKDYQYNVFDPITRDKVMAIISKSAGLYEAEFFNASKRHARISDLISVILGAFYQDSTRRLNDKDKNKLTMLSALIEPKAIWYEGWKHQKRTIREIEERDEFGEPIKFKEKKIVHYNGPWGERCNVLDIIPGSMRIRDLQEQPRIAWVTKMQMSEFRRQFPTSRFPEAAKVQPFRNFFENDETELCVRDDLKDNEVEVIRFFEKWDDRMSIIANYVMLNKPNSPMPFAHKDYPFVWGGFEVIHPDFIYDMPLPIKILDMQDMSNELLNLTLDMVWRALQEVILVANGDEINDDVLFGGGMVDVNDPKNFQQLQFGSNFAFTSARDMIDVARRSIESSSLDAPSSGQTATRQITAREVLAAREAAMEITTLFLQNMESMEQEKARLRVQNQLDRYHRPTEWMERIGEDLTKQAIPVFRELSVRDAKLANGKRGTVNIAITEEPRPQKDLDAANIENDKELSQTIDITPELIRSILFDVEIVANSSIKKSKSQQVAEARAFMTDALAAPQVLNPHYAAKEYVRTLGKKEDEALVQAEGAQDPMQQMLAKMGIGAGGTGSDPAKPKPAPKEFAPDSIESVLNQAL